MIKKDSMDQSIKIFSEINLDDEDFKNIFEEFKFIIENPKFKTILEKISNFNELKDENEIKTIMKGLSQKLSLTEMNLLLNNVIKNEKFVNFLQDLFLEKMF